MNIKKKLIVVLMVMALSLTGCGESSHQKDESNNILFDQFVIVEHDEHYWTGGNWHDFYTVYDKDTKVMYYFAEGYNRAMMSPIYNSDGTVKIWESK